jgi:plasmid stabilization system protein ParE
MDFKVIFRDTFLEDLERAVTSIAAHNPVAACKLGELIISAGESLSFFPERHPRVRQRPAIRRFIVKKHFKVFYRVRRENMTVEIVRCWDGRRGTEPSILEEENQK